MNGTALSIPAYRDMRSSAGSSVQATAFQNSEQEILLLSDVSLIPAEIANIAGRDSNNTVLTEIHKHITRRTNTWARAPMVDIRKALWWMKNLFCAYQTI